jgi:hypothetical protein
LLQVLFLTDLFKFFVMAMKNADLPLADGAAISGSWT